MVSYEPAMQEGKKGKEKKRKGSIYPLAAMTWSWREVMVPMRLSS
jgi:hypothetical protein